MYNWFNTTLALASFLSPIWILTAFSLSDSSLNSEIPSILFSFTRFAIFSINLALFTWYGNEVTMIFCLPLLISSISASALTVIFPLPVVYACLIASLPRIIPPVGKSGPFIICINCSSVTLSSSIIFTIPFITSVRLCGGIFVAIPTAIPDEPFIRSAGILAGKTAGSWSLSSKLGIKSTVFFSISVSISSEIFDILASV